MAEIVNIDHETGDLTQYDSTSTSSGDLSVTGLAALGGTSFGMNILVDDIIDKWGQKNFTAPTSYMGYRFYIDTNGLSMNNNTNFVVVYFGFGLLTTPYLRYTGGNYTLRMYYYDDVGFLTTNDTTLSDAEHYIEVLCTRATSDVSANGSYQYWVDGVLEDTESDVDNYNTFVSPTYIRMGAVRSIPATTSGTFFMDELIVRDDDTYIGPVFSGITIFRRRIEKC